MTKRKVLLLGGSGYLGAQIFRYLKQDQEIEIVATCFSSSSTRSALTCVDVKDASLFAGLLDEFLPDVVIWSLRGTDSVDAQELVSNGMQTLLARVSEQSKIIYLSTDGVFGQKLGPFTEEEETEVLDERNPLAGYCLAKIRGEELVRERHENHLILRFGPIYGKNDEGTWDKRVRELAVELEQGREVVRTGNLYKTFIHVDDLARAITEFVSSTYKGTFHLGPAEKESYYTFCRKMALGLELDPDLVKEDELTVEKAIELGIPLDTSLHTNKARVIVQTTFRNV